MRTTRTVTASLAALLGAAALAGPAAADSPPQRDAWYAGKSTIEGSKHSPQHAADDSAKANVYVTPATAFKHTVTPADDSAKANVYVTPATAFKHTVTPADDSATANVYVPPMQQRIQRHVPPASASSGGFDWGSAGIGASVAIGASLVGLGGVAGLRRRRQIQAAVTG
jgi:hypothetical protein